MKLRFFAAHTIVPTPKPEEQIVNKDLEASSASSFSESDEDSTSLSNDHSFDMNSYENDDTPLPEFDSLHANQLKHLLLSPLEPDMEF